MGEINDIAQLMQGRQRNKVDYAPEEREGEDLGDEREERKC